MLHTIDVSGLSPEAVQSVEEFVASLREQAKRLFPSTHVAGADNDPWKAAALAQSSLENFDFAAASEQRTLDAKRGQDHLK